MGAEWKATSDATDVLEGCDRRTSPVEGTGPRIDLAFRSTAQLRALLEIQASSEAQAKLVQDSLTAWTKVTSRRAVWNAGPLFHGGLEVLGPEAGRVGTPV